MPKHIVVLNSPDDDVEISDGHHTFEELYSYRLVYHAEAVKHWMSLGIEVVISLRHSDGELCFGGGYFIVVAQLPAGQVSNHYKLDCIDYFRTVPYVEIPPKYDGHTPQEALKRIQQFSKENQGICNV